MNISYCYNCGKEKTYEVHYPVTDELANEWEISDELKTLFNEREGKRCTGCGANIRSQVFAKAIIESKFGYSAKNLVEWVTLANQNNLNVCEINSCHELHATLKKLSNYTHAEYGTSSQQDIENLTYQDNRYDLVLHSEVLEHVNNPAKAMDECRRVINNQGLVLYTIPIVWNRKTRNRTKIISGKTKYILPKSYHGQKTEDYLVRHEFGGDVGKLLKSKVALAQASVQTYVLSSEKNGTFMTQKEINNIKYSEKQSEEKIRIMNKDNTTLENDYERMVPEFHKGTLTYAEHITRYDSAKSLVNNKIVLDIASGSGYGTKILASKAKYVYGVDVNQKAINYAKKMYNAKNIEYLVGDGEKIPLENDSVDLVTTFETIEHIKDYRKFLDEVSRVLKDEGMAIVSTPNDLEFAEGNHFHLHEFTYNELKGLLKKHFKHIDSYFQATSKFVALGDESIFNREGEIKVPVINLSPTHPNKYLYFYLVCSNKPIKNKIKPIASIGEHYSDRLLQQEKQKHQKVINDLLNENNKLEREITNIRKSKSYKLAKKLSSVRNKARIKRN